MGGDGVVVGCLFPPEELDKRQNGVKNRYFFLRPGVEDGLLEGRGRGGAWAREGEGGLLCAVARALACCCLMLWGAGAAAWRVGEEFHRRHRWSSSSVRWV